jgi:murein DD-endopeptidase MepM/ murein hydrolase activator NlpD
LKITGYQPDLGTGRNGISGGVVIVSYGNNWTGYYAHAKLLTGVKIGDFIPRGKAFAVVSNPGLGALHAHLCVIQGASVDPYDYLTDLRTPKLAN